MGRTLSSDIVELVVGSDEVGDLENEGNGERVKDLQETRRVTSINSTVTLTPNIGSPLWQSKP